ATIPTVSTESAGATSSPTERAAFACSLRKAPTFVVTRAFRRRSSAGERGVTDRPASPCAPGGRGADLGLSARSVREHPGGYAELEGFCRNMQRRLIRKPSSAHVWSCS